MGFMGSVRRIFRIRQDPINNCEAWIREHAVPRKTVCWSRTASELADQVANYYGYCVTDEEFTQAATNLGFMIKYRDSKTPSFNMGFPKRRRRSNANEARSENM